MLRRCIDQHGDTSRTRHVNNRFKRHIRLPGPQQGNHSHLLPIEHRIHFPEAIHLLDCHTHRTNGVVIGKPTCSGHDDLALHPTRIGQPKHQLGIATRHTSRCCVTQACRRARGHHPPLRPREHGQTLTHARHEFIHIDKKTRSSHHRLAHLRQHQRPPVNRSRTTAIDK